MSRLIQVQAPMYDVVDLITAKAALRVDTTADDQRITDLVRAATQMLEGGGGQDGILGRALMPQTWRLELPAWPYSGNYDYAQPQLPLPMPPLIAVTSVTYLDTTAVEQTLDPSIYEIADSGAGRAIFMLAYSKTFPTAFTGRPDAVRIVFDCGYRTLTSPTDNAVPEPIRQAILMLVQSLYDRPGQEDIPTVVHSLIAPFRVAQLGAIY
jgi:uncharacterized phiE125 gp8 family phage protein